MEYDKNRALKDLIDLNYYQGYHSGRWESENDMDDSSEEYLQKMKEFADEYNLEYDDNLQNYIEDDEYEAECYTQDRMGYEIKCIVEKKLLDILNG